MNEKMMELLAKAIVDQLPAEQKTLYQFIVAREDELAQQAETKAHFLTLLRDHFPHLQAARHFALPLPTVMERMRAIENEINDKLTERLDRYQWIDCTEQMHPQTAERKYFLLMA